MLQALALQAGGETTRAMAALEQALTLAEPEGFVRTFVDEGPAMEQILRAAAARGTKPRYVGQLLNAFQTTGATATPSSVSSAGSGQAVGSSSPAPSTAEGPVPSTAEALVEELSVRELEVLQLIAEGLTNREIGSRLYVSLNTVKAHTRNIYGKLGVHNRTGAVARARTLGLLAPH